MKATWEAFSARRAARSRALICLRMVCRVLNISSELRYLSPSRKITAAASQM